MMLRLINYEEIHNSLNEISGLVDLYDQKDAFFPIKVKEWNRKIEKVLENNQMVIAGNVGAYRSLLISAEQGVIPENVQFYGQPTRKKIVTATAAYALQQSAQLITGFLQQDHQRFDEAEKQVRQLLIYMDAKGLLSQFKDKTKDTETLKNIWSVLRLDPDLTQGALNVERLVDHYDVYILVNRVLASIVQ